MLSPSRILAVVLRQYYLLRGSPVRIVPHFAWVTIDIMLWGFISQYLATITPQGVSFVPTLLGAVVLWDFFIRVMHGVATAFLEDVWSRNFLNFFASPLGIAEYLAGLVVVSVVTSALALVVMLIIAMLVFGLSYAGLGLMLVPFFFVLFLFGIALGIFGAAVVLRLGPASEWFIWPLPALLCPFVGVFYPLATLPVWMQWIGRLLPPTYVFEWMRAKVAGAPASALDLLCGGGLALLFIVFACWFFAHIYRQAVRTGLIARYSAESVS